mmetsp:Transcript_124228/g.247531  ORF Transcript_124228/g.247531 Transcript_124228/m.247531 type:complete len:432 (-) Transcript_124228:77-1372(-)
MEWWGKIQNTFQVKNTFVKVEEEDEEFEEAKKRKQRAILSTPARSSHSAESDQGSPGQPQQEPDIEPMAPVRELPKVESIDERIEQPVKHGFIHFEEKGAESQSRKWESAPPQSTINGESNEDWSERQYQEDKKGFTPHPAVRLKREMTREPPGLHPVFHRQDLTKNVECMKEALGILEELLRKDPVQNGETADETRKYMEELGTAHKNFQEGFASLDKSLTTEKTRISYAVPNQEYFTLITNPPEEPAGPSIPSTPQPLQHPEFEAAKEAKYVLDHSTHSVMAYTRVLQSSANKRCMKLTREVLLVRLEGETTAPMTLTLAAPPKTTLNNSSEVTLQLDGQALEKSGCHRYKVWMYANDTFTGHWNEEDLRTWLHDCGDTGNLCNGWYERGTVDFAERSKCMIEHIDMNRLFAAGGKYIFLGVLLAPATD